MKVLLPLGCEGDDGDNDEDYYCWGWWWWWRSRLHKRTWKCPESVLLCWINWLSNKLVFPFCFPLIKNFLSSRLPVINTFTQSLWFDFDLCERWDYWRYRSTLNFLSTSLVRTGRRSRRRGGRRTWLNEKQEKKKTKFFFRCKINEIFAEKFYEYMYKVILYCFNFHSN